LAYRSFVGVAKPTGSGNAVVGVPADAYNPLLGTFHTLDIAPTPTSPIHANGRFRNIDKTDEHPVNSVVAGAEYDVVSNNGSWSGESEEHKEKSFKGPVRSESVPRVDNDKQEKIRQRNGMKPYDAKVKLTREACAKLPGLCQGLAPKDIVAREEIGTIIEDLGLNSKLKDQRLGFRAPKISIAERYSDAK